MTEEEELLGSDFVEHGIGEEIMDLLPKEEKSNFKRKQTYNVHKTVFGFSSPKERTRKRMVCTGIYIMHPAYYQVLFS